jgi:hypothetical protein
MCVLHSEKTAQDCLKAANWGVEQAIDHFYASGLAGQAGAGGESDLRSIEALYAKYKGERNPIILVCMASTHPGSGMAHSQMCVLVLERPA